MKPQNSKKIRSFRRSLRRFERLNQLTNQACCCGITLSQCHVLLEIETLGETTTKQLSENLMLDKSTLSRTVYALRKLGLIEAVEHENDRRFTVLKLTSKGKTQCNSLNEFNDELYEGLLGKLSQRERLHFLQSFDVIVQAMSEYCRDKNIY